MKPSSEIPSELKMGYSPEDLVTISFETQSMLDRVINLEREFLTEDFLTGTTFRYCIIVHASFFLCWDFAMLPAQLQSFSAI